MYEPDQIENLTLRQLEQAEAEWRASTEGQVEILAEEFDCLPEQGEVDAYDGKDRIALIDYAADDLVQLAKNIISDVENWRAFAKARIQARPKKAA